MILFFYYFVFLFICDLYFHRMQYPLTRIQRCDHQEQHTEIQEKRILRYLFVVI